MNTSVTIITFRVLSLNGGRLLSNNRLRHESIYHAMRSSRARFKYALRQCTCKLDERLLVSEKFAHHMENHEINDFLERYKKT